MLTADLVNARRYDGNLLLVPLGPKMRIRTLEMASFLLETARSMVGQSRDAVEEAWSQYGVTPAERRIFLGLEKLVSDACAFSAGHGTDPQDVRKILFALSSKHRAENPHTWKQENIVKEAAQQLGIPADMVMQDLFADLPGAQILTTAPQMENTILVARYEEAQEQSALLRAVRLRVDLVCAQPAQYRYLLRRLKFWRLLARIEAMPAGGYTLFLDGPMSLFDSTTKYGVQLALFYADIRASALAYHLDADVLWGKTRESLQFSLSSTLPIDVAQQRVKQHPFEMRAEIHSVAEGTSPTNQESAVQIAENTLSAEALAKQVAAQAALQIAAEKEAQRLLWAELPDEVAQLGMKLQSSQKRWSVVPSQEILQIAGLGVVVPDLTLRLQSNATAAHHHASSATSDVKSDVNSDVKSESKAAKTKSKNKNQATNAGVNTNANPSTNPSNKPDDESPTDEPMVVHIEVLGFWSRDAVWKRIELAQAGLGHRILFAVSERLRVSEKALDEVSPAMLYTYKGTMNAKTILDKVEQLAQRAVPSPDSVTARGQEHV